MTLTLCGAAVACVRAIRSVSASNVCERASSDPGAAGERGQRAPHRRTSRRFAPADRGRDQQPPAASGEPGAGGQPPPIRRSADVGCHRFPAARAASRRLTSTAPSNARTRGSDGQTSRMTDVSAIPGMRELWARTLGDERVVVAIIDGHVDASHPAFAGASFERAKGAWPEETYTGPMARHGTQIASVIFGQHAGPITGVAPATRGLSAPGFSDSRKRNSQLEMARAIETAVECGAHVINISGGELTPAGEATQLLEGAAR